MKKYVAFLFLIFIFAISCKHNNKNTNNTTTQFIVFFNTDSKWGELSAEVDDEKIESGAFIEVGKTISFKAKEKEGYCIDYWKINKDNKYNGQKEINIKLETNTNVFLYFKPKSKKYHMTYSFNENEGSLIAQRLVNGNKMPIGSGASIEEGSKIFFEAKPKEEFYIAGWTLNDIAVNGLNANYEFEIREDSNIKVEFSKKNLTPSIPNNLKIKKFFINTKERKPTNWLEPSSNGVDYNVEFPAELAGYCFCIWILGENEDAKFKEKNMTENNAIKANGKGKLTLCPLPNKNQTSTFVIVLSHNGEKFEYNLNVHIRGE